MIITNSFDDLNPCFNDCGQNRDQRHQQNDVEHEVHFSKPQKIRNVYVNAYVHNIHKSINMNNWVISWTTDRPTLQ